MSDASVELAKLYLDARSWPWELVPVAEGWLARRRHPNNDSLVERSSRTLADVLAEVGAFEQTLTKGP